MSYLSLFRMPTSMKITGRSSTITNAFINSIIPVVAPTNAEVKEALSILGMDKKSFQCSYCGDKASEWDHLRPLVLNKKPTGYISEIHNLVPACGKCNQSKGNTDWGKWIVGNAKQSPKSREIHNLNARIEKLKSYEAWRAPTKIDFESIVGKEKWQQHWDNWALVIETMKKSQILADEMVDLIAGNAHGNTDNEVNGNNNRAAGISLDEGEINEVAKVKRKLSLWINRPHQINTKILNKYLKITQTHSVITLDLLRSSLTNIQTFDSNFDQLRMITDNNHAKIFELTNNIVEIWTPVKPLVEAYKSEMGFNS